MYVSNGLTLHTSLVAYRPSVCKAINL